MDDAKGATSAWAGGCQLFWCSGLLGSAEGSGGPQKRIAKYVKEFGAVEWRCDSGDPFVAIEGIILRDPFSASVTEAEVLAQPTVHYLGLLSDTYATVRRYARCVGT